MKSKGGFVSIEEYKKSKLSFRDFEKEVFKKGLTPLRFKRNQNTISQKKQYKLFKSSVAIIGCGGLGGNVAEMLARVGVGKFTIIDKDKFCEHNLNRQNFSKIQNMKLKKVDILKKELLYINPALKIKKYYKKLDEKNIHKFLDNVNVVIDCVDDIKTKKLLALWCEKNNKKFVHGAIAGKSLQVCTSKKINNLYKSNDKGAEKVYGNLSMIATTCASFQALLCINLLLNKNFNFKNLLFCDLNNFEFININML